MKFIVLLGDGMSDEPIDELDGQTPLQAATTSNMDLLAKQGLIGLVETVPATFHPGSDVANLSVFGYDPASCYTGRSPLEAASMGVELAPSDVAFRLNLVTLGITNGDLFMEDFSAGHISTEEARELITTLQEELGSQEFQFYPGVSYRHLMVWRQGRDNFNFAPPHDLTNQSVRDQMPRDGDAGPLAKITTSAQLLFKNHPVNLRREAAGQKPANSIWLWGQGRRPQMPTLQEKFGLTGAVISAVDLIKGIGIYAGLDVINVPGATGYLDTNYRGKALAALEALETRDFVYVHVEAPDEAAHGGSLQDKIEAIERFDADVVGTVLNGIDRFGDHRVLLLPDHPTPVKKMTHTKDPVPFVLYGTQAEFPANGAVEYSELAARRSGVRIDPGYLLMRAFVEGKLD
ncbi:MAG: cofactor-independent phosphoglycerate mutase [Deltaproteobacteria bacterium]|jgi:2,3-bisphosphoglycerate-independent phosphoglycerate mutase|nr:cofactor-independent phosphoglycerate mutase [Deltaproteobacteria bacterium]